MTPINDFTVIEIDDGGILEISFGEFVRENEFSAEEIREIKDTLENGETWWGGMPEIAVRIAE